MAAVTFSGVDNLAYHSTRRLHRHHYRFSSVPAHENENEKRCGLNQGRINHSGATYQRKKRALFSYAEPGFSLGCTF